MYKINYGDERAEMLRILISFTYDGVQVLGLGATITGISEQIEMYIPLTMTYNEKLIMYMNTKKGMIWLNAFFESFIKRYYSDVRYRRLLYNYWEAQCSQHRNITPSWKLDTFVTLINKYGNIDEND